MLQQNNLLIIIIFFTINVFSFLTPDQVLILHDNVSSELKKFSIIHGAIEYESGDLKRLYEQKNFLAQFLFHLSKGQFSTSVAKNNPGSYFTYQEIGNLVLAIEFNELEKYLDILHASLLKNAQQKFPDYFRTANKRGVFKRHFKQFKINLNDAVARFGKNKIYELLFAYLYCKAISLQDGIESYKILDSKLKLGNEEEVFYFDERYYENLILNCDCQNLDIQDPKIYFIFLIQKNYCGKFPAQLIQQYYVFDDTEIPDCLEVSLREFCNNYLRNGTKFNLKKLPKNLKSKPLANFYDGNYGALNIRSHKHGCAWFVLLSGLPNIEYVRKEQRDMRPTKANVLNSLNFLFSINATNFDELCQTISSDKMIITYKEEKEETQQGIADVLLFFFKDFYNSEHPKQFLFVLHLLPYEKVWHAWTEIRPSIY